MQQRVGLPSLRYCASVWICSSEIIDRGNFKEVEGRSNKGNSSYELFTKRKTSL